MVTRGIDKETYTMQLESVVRLLRREGEEGMLLRTFNIVLSIHNCSP